MSQVDGLVDYSDSDDTASDTTSGNDAPPDSNSWLKKEMQKLRKHANYSDIVNYRDDGDDKWHNRMTSILNTMKRNSISCLDLYNKDQYVKTWIEASPSPTLSPRKQNKEADSVKEYPEWGVIDWYNANPRQQYPDWNDAEPNEQHSKPPSSWPSCSNVARSTIPPEYTMEQDVMLHKEMPSNQPTMALGAVPKRIHTTNTSQGSSAMEYPEIELLERDMRVLYVVKDTTPKDQQQKHDFDETVSTILKKYGAQKVQYHWARELSRRATSSSTKRLARVMEAWSSGDVKPRNPFLHKSLWHREDSRLNQGLLLVKEENLAGYDPEAEDDRILSDLRELDA